MPGIRVFEGRNDMRLTHMMASAALFALTAALPASAMAGGLLDADVSLGGGNLASIDVGANVGGIHGDVDAKVGSTTTATAAVGTTTGTTVKTSVGGLRNAAVRAEALGVVHAKARLLSQKQLLKLCVTVGARGCGGASRSQQLSLVDARLNALTPQQLARACVAVGGSCGAAPAASGGSGNGAGSGASTGSGGAVANARLASAEDSGRDRDTRITCRSILASPARYETGLVKLCRKIAQ